MKRLKKEKWEGRTISDNQRLPTAKMVHAFAELYSGKLLMDRTVMGYWHQDFLR